ncbi:hypothetical protein Cni_G28490 [Canna indica]|uniref:Uncharacterized protein n=1 Tax=Canna indica TaxID=4628 RepID=A0AAQ3L6N6_9LILI|nr:hypothetical protein Cni_G28490 [Canna indica]
MAAERSKALLDPLSTPSFPENLLICGKRPARLTRGHAAAAAAAASNADSKPKHLPAAIPRSQILDKVKGFLGVIAEANDKLELDVREGKHADYDVEVLGGNEKEYIEMDLLLGVADLHNAEAVAAAEAALSGLPPSVPSISASFSYTDDDDDEKDASCSSEKLDADEAESVRENKQKKRPKIVVLDSSSG